MRSLIPGADEVSHPVLLDTLPLFYGNIAEALSPGSGRENAASDSSAATGHGSERARATDYKAIEIVREYQLLRDALLEVARRHGIRFSDEELRIIGCSFDQAIRDAISQPAAQSASLSLVALDALALAREVAEHVNDTTRAHCVAGGESVIGWWDESALRRALENLASNAAK